MEIKVQNLGKIRSGKFDFDKKINVFVGYNNSGKTYFSQLLWKLCDPDINITPIHEFNTLKVDNKEYFHIDESAIESATFNYRYALRQTILPELFHLDRSHFLFENFSIQFVEDFINKIKNVSYVHLSVNVDKADASKPNQYTEYYVFRKEAESLDILITKEQLESPTNLVDIFQRHEINSASPCYENQKVTDIYSKAINKILTSICFNQGYSPTFLSANREYYPSFYKYIYSVAKEENDKIAAQSLKKSYLNIAALSKRPYTEAMDESIQRMYNLDRAISGKGNDNYSSLLHDLKEIIGGDIEIRKSEGIAPVEIYYKIDDKKELDMYMSSSSVNQLTILYLYLKYWASSRNNFVIIDEPEINLHPENQIKLVNVLMKFANLNNNKILLTTHSPLMAEIVNNYANLAFLKEKNMNADELMNSLHMCPLDNIKHSDFGIYFFNGDTIKNYDLGDYGVYFKDFQNTIERIRETSSVLRENIYNSLNSNG